MKVLKDYVLIQLEESKSESGIILTKAIQPNMGTVLKTGPFLAEPIPQGALVVFDASKALPTNAKNTRILKADHILMIME